MNTVILSVRFFLTDEDILDDTVHIEIITLNLPTT